MIDAFAEQYDARLAAIFDASDASRWSACRYFDAGKADMLSCDHARGCLTATWARSLGAQRGLRARLDQVFRAWERRPVACLEEARSAGEVPEDLDTEALAGFIMAGWEGAILRAKTVKSLAPMECFEAILFRQVLARELPVAS